MTDATATRPEHQLISRALSGDQNAFAELFEAHKNHVYSLCLRMTSNIAEAEDLTQDAFIQVFRKLSTFRGDSALSTWIYRVAMNTTLMHFRKKALRQISLDQRADTPGEKTEKIDLCQDDGRLRVQSAIPSHNFTKRGSKYAKPFCLTPRLVCLRQQSRRPEPACSERNALPKYLKRAIIEQQQRCRWAAIRGKPLLNWQVGAYRKGKCSADSRGSDY